MDRLQIKDLYNPILITQRQGFINAVNEILPIQGEWLNGENKINVNYLDDRILNELGEKCVNSLFNEKTTTTYIRISHVLSSHRYTLDTLFNTLGLDYNPIENYNMIERHTGTDILNHGAKQETNVIGERNNSNTYGEQTFTTNIGNVSATDTHGEVQTDTTIGEQITTNSIGNVSTTDTHGEVQTDTTIGEQTVINNKGNVATQTDYGSQSNTASNTNTVSPFDIDTFVNNDKSDSTNIVGSHTDTHTEQARTDSTVNGTRSDSETVGEHTDTHTEQARTDSTVNGTRSDSETIREHTDTHTEQARTDRTVNGTRSDSETIGSHTDTHTEQARTDSTVNGTHTDTHTSNSATDTHTENSYDDTTSYDTTLTRSGNIGVQTTQSMILQQREVALFDFYKAVIEIINSEMCLSLWEVL